MQRAKVGLAVEGGGRVLDNFELQLGFIGKPWYVISTPILDCLVKMTFTKVY